LRYLQEQRNHPTADQIYRNLRGDLPSLSRASVYNTLSVLEKTGLIRPLTINGVEMHYDAFVEDHGHFCCRRCGTIYDFEFSAEPDFTGACGLDGFQIERRDFLIWGLCSNCAGCARS
jgi:Fe2+ or Zn2+ uptake regulation protein